MSPSFAPAGERRELERHPAYLAWRLACEDPRPPAAIETLKLEKRKSAVYRLTLRGRGRRSAIAKRRPQGELAMEARLHEELLPDLGIGTLELYGYVTSYDGFDWLFLEDAGETRYSRDASEHRSLAADWLGRLHAGAAPGPSWLPDTGPAYFRGVLELARDGLRMGLVHPAVSESDRDVLNAIGACLDAVEERWERIEGTCARLPRTLVHGDFVAKNVRIRERQGRLDLVAFDWETAGVGPPAVDLALLRGTGEDLRTYLSIVNDAWPDVRLLHVEQLVIVGDVFRLLHCVYWAGRSFKHDWVQHAMWDLIEYEHELQTVLADDRWNDG